jgi:glycosyltransferase involved in cell wall biosynthesis
MRLLYLTRDCTLHDARWLRALAGHVSALAFLSLRATPSPAFRADHPRIDFLPASAADEAAVVAAIEAWKPDVILAGPLTDAGHLAVRHWPERTLLASWAFDVLHEPLHDPAAALRLRETLRLGRHLFTDAAFLQDACADLAGHAFVHTCVLPWGLAAEDVPAPRLGWRASDEQPADRVVLHARGFSAVHRPLHALESFRLARAEDPRLRLWLAGEGPLRAEVEAAVRASDLAGHVRFLGHLPPADLAGCLSEADVYFACAACDGSSITLLQAMHAGLPCVASDLPGNRAWLADTGAWLVPPDQPAATARDLLAAAALPAPDRSALAARLRHSVATRADLSANLSRLLHTLRLVAAHA